MRFQTIHHHSVDVAHRLMLLFGIGTGPSIMGFEDKVEQSHEEIHPELAWAKLRAVRVSSLRRHTKLRVTGMRR
jgi:hypothetical protein